MEPIPERSCRPEAWPTVSGSKSRTSTAVKALVLTGGGWLIIIALWATAIQFNLSAVAQGQMPLSVAWRFGIDSLPVLIILFVFGVVAIWLVLRKNINSILTGSVLTFFGGILLFGVYLARFSIGLFLLLPAFMLLSGGILSLIGRS
jgi:hypothetical protein